MAGFVLRAFREVEVEEVIVVGVEFARDVEFEVIEYGDPDNAGSDLKGHNQVYLRAEAYIGWAVLDGNAFAKIEA